MKFEQLYLDHYQPWIETGKGYNICKMAGSNLGIKLSKETKTKMSASHQRNAEQHDTFTIDNLPEPSSLGTLK